MKVVEEGAAHGREGWDPGDGTRGGEEASEMKIRNLLEFGGDR